MKFVNTCVQFLPSLLVARILKTVDALARAAEGQAASTALTRNVVRRQGYFLCLALFLSLGIKTIVENQYFHQG